MAVIFPTQPGRVAVVVGAPGGVVPIAVDGDLGEWFPSLRAILRGGNVALDDAVQFTHTLGEVLYVVPFGARISQMRLDGLAFAGEACGGMEGGLEAALAVYHRNKASARQSPVQIQIGTSAAGRFRGYLTRFTADLGTPELPVSPFSFILDVTSAGT